MKLIQQEQEWRRPPEPQKRASGKDAQVTLARWSNSEITRPLECISDHADSNHVVSLALRCTTSELFIGGKKLRAGSIPAGTTFVAGPIPRRCSTVFFEGFEFLQIYLSPGLLYECFEAAYGRAPNTEMNLFAPHFTSDPRIRTLARTLASVDPNGGPLGLVFVESVGAALTSLLLGIGSGTDPTPSARKRTPLAKWRLNRTLEYIEANIDRSLSLTELSAVADLSRVHFAAQFKAATGRAPYAYVLSRKVTRAKQLLLNSSLAIGEIALELDFSSSAHFTQVFKSLVGETPGRWRRRQEIPAAQREPA